MEADITCGDIPLANTSTSSKIGLDYSCDRFLREFQNKQKGSSTQNNVKCESPPGDFLTTSSSSSMSSALFAKVQCSKREPSIKAPNISYELAVAKSVMQQLSSISGDNLFDHLSDIIKRVIDERPPNVIDFFEEFSRNVREQKFHLPERFPPNGVFDETRLYKVAKKQLISMSLPYPPDSTIHTGDELEEEHSKQEIITLELKQENLHKFYIFNDRVQYLQFFWNQCGLSISSEDIFQLACSMNRLQDHPSIMQCRFWGMINGLRASYYIVEAMLSKDEYESRLLQMHNEMQRNFMVASTENAKNQKLPSHVGPELIPGSVGWENQPEEDIIKMKPPALPVPLVKKTEVFDVPPEPIGKGVNRYSYFVVTSLSDEWIELPIVTPKQITQSRDIKKFFTGDLEEDIVSYPGFCGKEKHYLRAMIARITAGTYIAPQNYYRKMTKRERHLFASKEDHGEDEEDEVESESEIGEEEDEEEKIADNDIVMLKNEKYDSSAPIGSLNNPEKWVHVRPNILLQGRVVWYDQDKAEREREHKRLQKKQTQEELDADESDRSDDEEDEADDEEGEEENEVEEHAEKGPAILSRCSRDKNSETSMPWVGRLTSKFTNHNERILVMQSNVWPGACTFIFKDLCESIYLGWGHKVVSRNMDWKHLPLPKEEYKHNVKDFVEAIDPSVQMEDDYKLSLVKKEFKFTQMDDFDEHDGPESSNDDEDEDEDEEDEE